MTACKLMIALCIAAIVAQAHAAALPAQNDYIVFPDDRKITSNAIPNVADSPFESIKVTELRVRSEIALRYARTSVVTHVRNPDARAQEATFRMLLPDTAFISNFTMILGGTSYIAYVEKKEEAAQIYRQAVSEGAAAAHVATKARDSYEFTVSVNLEGNSTAVFDLRYEELLVRRNGLYHHTVNLHPGSFVPKMEVVVHIKESQKITKLSVPEVRTGNEVDATEEDPQNSKAVIRYSSSKREVTVTFAPDLPEQARLAEIYKRKSRENSSLDEFIGYSSIEDEQDELESRSTLLGQFVVQYDVERTNNGEILVNDGYFVHFLAPSSLPPLSKYVVFVLDTSGSMIGRKSDQLRTAMSAILSALNPNDFFNIVEFNSVIKIHDLSEADEVMSYTDYQPRSLVAPARASPDNIQRAKVIVSEFDFLGATDIYGALDVALNLTKHVVPYYETTESANTNASSSSNHENTGDKVTSKRVECEPIIIFLTDGSANFGEQNNYQIISLITAKNSGVRRASIYSVAFGEDADRVFLRELSLRNEGFMRHIYEAADAALQLRDFYRQVASPLLADVRFLYPRKQIKEGSLSRINFRTLNAGAEAAVVGKIADNITEITPRVRGLRGSEDGVRRELYEESSKVAVSHDKDLYLPLERLWAYLTIKQLLDKRDADENAEEKALAIALKYGFVTPLTSLVVVKPKESKVKEINVKGAEAKILHTPHSASRLTRPLVMAPLVPATRQKYVGTYDVRRNRTNIRDIASVSGFQNDLVRYSPDTYDVSYNTITDMSNPSEPVVLITSTNTDGKATQKKLFVFAEDEKQPTVSVTFDTTNYLLFNKIIATNGVAITGEPVSPNSSDASAVAIAGNGNQMQIKEDDDEEGKGTQNQFKEVDDEEGTLPICDENELFLLRWSRMTLEDFEWIPMLLNTTSNFVLNEYGVKTLEVVNATTGVLAGLYQDEECSLSVPVCQSAANKTQYESGACVYITRCPAAQFISADDYHKLYSCTVNGRYAGVCCRQYNDYPRLNIS